MPRKSLDCLRDLVSMYEACTVDDVYEAYAALSLADEDLWTCVGISGTTPPGEVPPPVGGNGVVAAPLAAAGG